MIINSPKVVDQAVILVLAISASLARGTLYRSRGGVRLISVEAILSALQQDGMVKCGAPPV